MEDEVSSKPNSLDKTNVLENLKNSRFTYSWERMHKRSYVILVGFVADFRSEDMSISA